MAPPSIAAAIAASGAQTPCSANGATVRLMIHGPRVTLTAPLYTAADADLIAAFNDPTVMEFLGFIRGTPEDPWTPERAAARRLERQGNTDKGTALNFEAYLRPESQRGEAFLATFDNTVDEKRTSLSADFSIPGFAVGPVAGDTAEDGRPVGWVWLGVTGFNSIFEAADAETEKTTGEDDSREGATKQTEQSFQYNGPRSANYGIVLNGAAIGKGFGLEILHLCLAYAFAALKVDTVDSCTAVKNAAMKAHFDRTGFVTVKSGESRGDVVDYFVLSKEKYFASTVGPLAAKVLSYK